MFPHKWNHKLDTHFCLEGINAPQIPSATTARGFSVTARAKPAKEMKNQSREQFQEGDSPGLCRRAAPPFLSRGRDSTPRSPHPMGVPSRAPCQPSVHTQHGHLAHVTVTRTPSPCWKKLGLRRALKSGFATVRFFQRKLYLMKIPETQGTLFSF